MAVTVSRVNHSVAGNEHIDTLDVTLDSSYPTGGEALTLTSYIGGKTVRSVTASIKSSATARVSDADYDKTNSKIIVKARAAGDAGAAAEVADTTDLSATVVTLRVVSQ